MARRRGPPPTRKIRSHQRVANRFQGSPAGSLKRPDKNNRHLNSKSPLSARVVLAKKLEHKPIATPLADSDDSDQLVTKTANTQSRWGRVLPARNEIYMSGGVAQGDTPGAHPSRKRKRQDAPQDSQAKRSRTTNGQPSGGQGLVSSLNAMSPLAPLGSTRATVQVLSSASPSSAATSLSRPGSLAPNRIQRTPGAETSILGALKPRKRQPSILQILDDRDSSSLDKEDENDFLPDDESTPPLLSKSTAVTSTPDSLLPKSAALRDKLSSSGLRRPTRNGQKISPLPIEIAPGSSPPSTPLLPTQIRRHSPTKQTADKESVMATPQSSSADNSPAKLRPVTVSNSEAMNRKGAPRAMTTEALQSLMPFKNRRTKRQNTQSRNEFDIPEDSSSSRETRSITGDKNDESSFLPAQRKGRKRARKETVVRSAHAQNTRKASKDGVAGTTAGIAKAGHKPISVKASTRATTKTLNQSSRLSKNGLGAINSRGSVYSGGARHASTIGSATGEDGDKENQPSEIDLVDPHSKIPAGLQAIKAKFAEIDDWDMEFEDVDVVSSSPGKR